MLLASARLLGCTLASTKKMFICTLNQKHTQSLSVCLSLSVSFALFPLLSLSLFLNLALSKLIIKSYFTFLSKKFLNENIPGLNLLDQSNFLMLSENFAIKIFALLKNIEDCFIFICKFSRSLRETTF